MKKIRRTNWIVPDQEGWWVCGLVLVAIGFSTWGTNYLRTYGRSYYRPPLFNYRNSIYCGFPPQVMKICRNIPATTAQMEVLMVFATEGCPKKTATFQILFFSLHDLYALDPTQFALIIWGRHKHSKDLINRSQDKRNNSTLHIFFRCTFCMWGC